MLKKISLAVSAVSLFGFGSLAAAEEFDSALGKFDVSMTATLATDYIWRGQTQSAEEAAIQGSIDVAHESGLYAGIWASNVDGDTFPGNTKDASIEVDFYVGYGANITDDISYDLQLAKYTYPAASSMNGYEIMPSISAYGFTLGYKYGVETGYHPTYIWAGYEYELPYEITAFATYGKTDSKEETVDYTDWSIGLSKTIAGLDFTVTYTDTDLGDDCVDSLGYTKNDYCDGNVTLAVSKTF